MSLDLPFIELAGDPDPGFYRMKRVRGGVWCAVRIWHGPPHDPDTGEELDRSWRWQATLDGEPVELRVVWPYCAREPIDQTEHDYLVSLRAWAVEHAPETPEAAPRQRVDLDSMKPPF